ncbi:MAG: hypothetical protein QOJ99_5125 [Bryobacterales bacterium]|jgi:hypothetical protein|nr:hypothetical protein [Bryobacterales bacterium]
MPSLFPRCSVLFAAHRNLLKTNSPDLFDHDDPANVAGELRYSR